MDPAPKTWSVEKDEHFNFLVCPSLPQATAAAVRSGLSLCDERQSMDKSYLNSSHDRMQKAVWHANPTFVLVFARWHTGLQ
jgi:hypothetical protein